MRSLVELVEEEAVPPIEHAPQGIAGHPILILHTQVANDDERCDPEDQWGHDPLFDTGARSGRRWGGAIRRHGREGSDNTFSNPCARMARAIIQERR